MGGVFGQQDLNSGNTPFNELSFVVQMALSKLNVATLVQVQAVNAGSGLAPVGTVDVLPLVNQVAGDGSAMPHATIHGMPYLRIQGGANAIVCDPAVGDVGFCVFADRDISTVQASGAQGPPGSARRFDMADGLYLGGWCSNLTPTNYVQVTDEGINVVLGSTTLELTAGECTITANTKIIGTLEVTGQATFDQAATVTGNLTVGGDVVSAGISLDNHVHVGVQVGGGTTGGPQG